MEEDGETNTAPAAYVRDPENAGNLLCRIYGIMKHIHILRYPDGADLMVRNTQIFERSRMKYKRKKFQKIGRWPADACGFSVPCVRRCGSLCRRGDYCGCAQSL